MTEQHHVHGIRDKIFLLGYAQPALIAGRNEVCVGVGNYHQQRVQDSEKIFQRGRGGDGVSQNKVTSDPLNILRNSWCQSYTGCCLGQAAWLTLILQLRSAFVWIF